MLEAQRIKAEAIFEVNSLVREPAGKKLLDLLDILIKEARLENDTILKDNLQFNQGKIAGWGQLRDYLVRGVPGPPKIA